MNITDPVPASLSGVSIEPMAPNGFPLLIQPESDALKTDLAAATAWVRESKATLDGLLRDAGGILFRGFPLSDAAAFGEFLTAYPDHEGGYVGGTSARGVVTGRVMESTQAPPDRYVPIHQEMAYAPRYPLKLAFYCEVAPAVGGETPICNMRMLEREMATDLFDKVRARGLQYKRHFREPDYATGIPELDIVHRTWQLAFQTEDRAEAERQANAMGSNVEWDASGMTVSNPSRGFVDHPETGEVIWFNSIGGYGFSRAVLGEKMGALYEEYYGDHRPLPFWVTYGDGERIRGDETAPLYEATGRVQASIPWQHGDVILLDNILAGHGRNTFEGERAVRVALLS